MVGTGTIISIENPRQIILSGMAQVEKLISRAFGPRGANVSVTLSSHQVVSHKQGSVIVQGVHSPNSIEENGINQMRRVGRFVSDAVGDGTKTAMLLAYALVEGGQSALTRGKPLKDVLHGMEQGLIAARSSVVSQSQACAVDCLSAIALTASGDREISDVVLEAMRAAGKDGIIVVETKSGPSTELKVQEGLRFDRGYLSDKFVKNPREGNCELNDCRVLVYEPKISNMKDLLPLLEQVVRGGHPLLVIADDVEGEALSTLLVNVAKGIIECAAVRAPGSGDRRRALLQDIAILTGAKLVTADFGPRLESIRLQDLGGADKVVVTRDDTTIFGRRGHGETVRAHIDALRAEIDRTRDPHDREKLQERLANLAGRIAIVRIGGATEVDVEERRYRAVSALHSTRAAIEEGWSYGGGVALLNAKEAIASLPFQTEGQETGAAIVAKALDAPFSVLAASCQKSPVSLLSERQRLAQPAMGLNAESGSLEDMRLAGILDPTKTLRVVIDTAFSYARTILKTDLWSVRSASPEKSDETTRF